MVGSRIGWMSNGCGGSLPQRDRIGKFMTSLQKRNAESAENFKNMRSEA